MNDMALFIRERVENNQWLPRAIQKFQFYLLFLTESLSLYIFNTKLIIKEE